MVGTAVPDGAKRGLLLPTTQAALEMVKVGGAVVGFWFQRGTEQLVHTSQTLKKLAAARDWQEALEIQNSFLRDGLSRLNDGMSRYASEAGRIVARSRQARSRRVGSDSAFTLILLFAAGWLYRLRPWRRPATDCCAVLTSSYRRQAVVNGRCGDCGLAMATLICASPWTTSPAAYRPGTVVIWCSSTARAPSAS